MKDFEKFDLTDNSTPVVYSNSTASPVQGAASASVDCVYYLVGGVGRVYTNGEAKGAAVKPWQERMAEAGHDSEPDVFNKMCWELEAKDAEIADWRARAAEKCVSIQSWRERVVRGPGHATTLREAAMECEIADWRALAERWQDDELRAELAELQQKYDAMDAAFHATALKLKDAETALADRSQAVQPTTYASTQATNCAGCGEHKHTPLRIDAMGGYVCLTCIDQKLGSLLGEFGYATPAPEQEAAPAPAATPEWTCFHCDERFTDRDAAALHFGTSERQDPICKVSQAEYRSMEARMVDYNDEDAEIHRQMHRQRIEHHHALQRAEEAGYARGLRDAPATTPAEQANPGPSSTACDDQWAADTNKGGE